MIDKELVMGPGLKILTQVGLGQFFVARVGLGQPFMVWGCFGKHQILQFFSLRVKKNLFGLGQKVPGSEAGQPLIYCGSKVSLGQGPSL